MELAVPLSTNIYNIWLISYEAKVRHYNSVFVPKRTAFHCSKNILRIKRSVLRSILGPKISEEVSGRRSYRLMRPLSGNRFKRTIIFLLVCNAILTVTLLLCGSICSLWTADCIDQLWKTSYFSYV